MGKDKVKIGFTASTFDLLHAGHVQMLREAKEHCDYLMCGLQIDPTIDREEKNSPVQTVVERYTQLNGVKYVDEIIPYSTERDLEDIITEAILDLLLDAKDNGLDLLTFEDVCKMLGVDDTSLMTKFEQGTAFTLNNEYLEKLRDPEVRKAMIESFKATKH